MPLDPADNFDIPPPRTQRDIRVNVTHYKQSGEYLHEHDLARMRIEFAEAVNLFRAAFAKHVLNHVEVAPVYNTHFCTGSTILLHHFRNLFKQMAGILRQR